MQKKESINGETPAWAEKLERLRNRENELLERSLEVRLNSQRMVERIEERINRICDIGTDIDELKLLVYGLEKKMDAVLSWIAADKSDDRQELRRKLRELREKTNGLTFSKTDKRTIPPANEQPQMTLAELAELRQAITTRFNEEELKTLCFDIGVDYDSLRGEGKAAKVRELVDLKQRQGRVGRLRQWLE